MLDTYLSILLTPAVLFVLGLLIGSFLNVVVHRLPRMLERAWKDAPAFAAGRARQVRTALRPRP